MLLAWGCAHKIPGPFQHFSNTLLWFSMKNILQLFQNVMPGSLQDFFLLSDLPTTTTLSAKIPIVFFSAFLKSKYLAMDFSPWHPTASPDYCGVCISLIDINQFCRKPALPSRQAPAPGLAQHIWYCQWQSLCESLRGDALTGRNWEAIRNYFPYPGHCAWTFMMILSGLDIHKAISAFHMGGIMKHFSKV